MHAILGTKTEQTQKFRTDGKRIPVTIVAVENTPVFAVKTMDKHGYWAVQIGQGTAKNPSKPLQGHIKGANTDKAPRFLKEVRMADGENMPQVGDTVSLDAVLQPGDTIDVTGTSKGKGFAGGVKRHHFRGGPRTHGQSDRERAPGSIGQTTTPGRVYKGKRMAGKMGFETVTVKNLTVADVVNNTLYIEGLIPGPLGALVKVTKTGTDEKFVPLLKDEAEAPVAEEVQGEEAVKEEVVEAPKEEKVVEAKEEAPVVEAAEAVEAKEEVTTQEVKEDAPVQTAEETEVTPTEDAGEPKEEAK